MNVFQGIGLFLLGMLVSFIGDLIEIKKMKNEYETKIEKLEKDNKILKGSNLNG